MHPIAFQASLHRWDLFVTLTFKSRTESGSPLKMPKEDARERMLFAYLQQAAKGRKRDREGNPIERVPFRFLRWVAREERGERGGRYHWHILLEGLPPSRLNRSEHFVQKAIWSEVGGGYADVRAFDTRLDGVSYVMKGLEGWSQKAANSYEMGKFGADHEDRKLILSESCVRLWGAGSGYGGASSDSRKPTSRPLRPLPGGNAGARKWTKETLEAALWGSIGLNQHPAGVSFVR